MERFENYEIGPAPKEFWVEVNGTGSTLAIRQTPTTQENNVLKRVPDGWVLNVTNTHQDEKIHDGYIWWEVEDVTDGIKGWSASEYLKVGDQNELRNRTKRLNTKDERISVILEAVDHYYINEDTTPSLYSSNDKNNRLSIFNESDFPIEIILAIIALEAPPDFNNEYISYDCGRGIAQITSNGYVGISNNIRCYHDGRECLEYEYAGNIVDKNLNIFKDDELDSYCHGSCCHYYYKDEKGKCKRKSCADCSICENTNDKIGNGDDCGQEWCKETYGDKYVTDKCEEDKKCEVMEKCECWRCKCRCNVNCKCKHYTNAKQGIYANIKDELRVLQEKYEIFKRKKWEEKTINCDGSSITITSDDFEKILAIWGYNGITLDPEKNYLRDVAGKREDLNSYFGENYKEYLEDTISDEDLKNWTCKLEWVNDYRDIIKAEMESPIELRVYDSQGRATGLINGEVKEKIPNSIFDGKTVIIFFPSDSYKYDVIGTDEGTYGLTIGSLEDGNAIIFIATGIPTLPVVKHQYTIDWDALSQGEEGVTVQVDSDGDGIFEQTITSDGELTYDEFMLQTATTIDFDPDTLNLQSKGKWVTVYTELPAGYNVTEINVSTMLLNETVPAELHPTEIGDYDDDGIADLMVKFNQSAVQEILEVGDEVEITVTGELTDGTPFGGSDMTRVIDQS